MKKILVPIFLCFLLSSCGDAVPADNNAETNINVEASEPVVDGTAATEERPAGVIDPMEEADAVVKDINQNIESYTKVESEKTIKEVNVCDITTHVSANKTQKKVTSVCFDGDRTSREGTIYYLNNQPVFLELVVEKVNASPLNLAEYDESKTITTKYSLYLKDGSLEDYYKILDKDGEEITTLNEYRQEDLTIVKATFK